jgi:hypothetical protein
MKNTMETTVLVMNGKPAEDLSGKRLAFPTASGDKLARATKGSALVEQAVQ